MEGNTPVETAAARDKFKTYLIPNGNIKGEGRREIAPLITNDANRTVFTEELAQSIKSAKDGKELTRVLTLGLDAHQEPQLKEHLRSKLAQIRPEAKDNIRDPNNPDYTTPEQLLPEYDIVRKALAEKLQTNPDLLAGISFGYTEFVIPPRLKNLSRPELIAELLKSNQISTPIPSLPTEIQVPVSTDQSQVEDNPKTSFEKFEQPDPNIVENLKYFGDEKLGRRVMFGNKHVGQLLPSKEGVPVLVLDNGLVISMQQIDHREPGKWMSAFATKDDLILPENLTRGELTTKLISTGKKQFRNLADDILGLNMRAEYASNNSQQEAAAEKRLDSALDTVDDEFMRRLPKNIDKVISKLSLFCGKSPAPQAPATSPT